MQDNLLLLLKFYRGLSKPFYGFVSIQVCYLLLGQWETSLVGRIVVFGMYTEAL